MEDALGAVISDGCAKILAVVFGILALVATGYWLAGGFS